MPDDQPEQLDMFSDCERRLRQHDLSDAVDAVRCRFGGSSLVPASLLRDLHMAQDKCETVPMPGTLYRGR